jgi:Asp-tRNA(Asn)/Glu-tRNA(Gln) amidotransferase B subunit
MDAYTLFLKAVDEGHYSAEEAVQVLQGYIDDDLMEEIVQEEGLRDLEDE